MKEMVGLLRQKLLLIQKLIEHAAELRKALVSCDAEEVRALSKKAEPLVEELSKLEDTVAAKSGGVAANWVETQPESPGKELAGKLVQAINVKLYDLKIAHLANTALLGKNMAYLDYNINVLTQTTASATYGRGNGEQGLKMFEADV